MSKLHVSVYCLRTAGVAFPQHNLAFVKPRLGILLLNDEHVPELHRHSLVARLVDPATGAQVEGLARLIDARLVRMMSDELVVTGIERVADGLTTRDCAQSWLVQIDRFE